MTTITGDLTPADTRKVQRGFEQTSAGLLTPLFGQVGIQEIDFKARWGASDFSTTRVTVEISGTPVSVTLDNMLGEAARFEVGDEVQGTPLGFEDVGFVYGTVLAKTDATLSILIQETSTHTGTYDYWQWQVVNRPKAWLEVDVSLTSINPTTVEVFSITVNSGKFFPVGGSVLMRPNIAGKKHIALQARVRGYASTTLLLSKVATNATVSESIASWDVALIDGSNFGDPLAEPLFAKSFLGGL